MGFLPHPKSLSKGEGLFECSRLWENAIMLSWRALEGCRVLLTADPDGYQK